jgi:pimeloyl-ACP methyl ester carboxylesterase
MSAPDDEGAAVSETMVPANGVDLCVEAFGERGDPPLLLIAGAGSSMDWWEDEFCRRLAAGGRLVIRYDHRDTGRSSSFTAGAPPYSQVDLTDDALGLLDALELPPAHIVGLSMGGGIAQRIAVEHPDRLATLTLMSTTAARMEHADGERDAEPAPSADENETDWSDRKAAVDRLVTDVRRLGGPFTADEPQLRRLVERVFDRTADMAASQLNHWLAGSGAPIRDRLATITAPTLVLHGTQDPVFPMADAETLVREIPGARLVTLDGVGHEYPPAALWNVVVAELLRHTG